MVQWYSRPRRAKLSIPLAAAVFLVVLCPAHVVRALDAAPSTFWHAALTTRPDTLTGTTPYGSYRIIRTDTSFSGTVIGGSATIFGVYRADTLELRRVTIGSALFNTRKRYPIQSQRWEAELVSISSLVHTLARAKQKLERTGRTLPSGIIDFVSELLPGEHDPICDPPTGFPIRFEFFYGSLTGNFTIYPGCIAILVPGASTSFTDVEVWDGGALLSLSPGEVLDAHLNAETVTIKGTVDIDGEVRAETVRLDGSAFGASVDAGGMDIRGRLEVVKGRIDLASSLRARRSALSGGNARSIALRDHSTVTVGSLDAELLSVEESQLRVNGNAKADFLTLSTSEMTVELGLESELIRASNNSSITADHLRVTQNPQLTGSGRIELTSSMLSLTADAEASQITLDNSDIRRSNIITTLKLQAAGSNVNAAILNADDVVAEQTRFILSNRLFSRTAPARVTLDSSTVTTPLIDVRSLNALKTVIRTPLMVMDTFLTDRVQIFTPTDSIRINVSQRSSLIDTYVPAKKIHATLGEAFVNSGTLFDANEGGGVARSGTVPYSWSTLPGSPYRKHTGASYGGYGGTYAALNTNVFIPADEVVGSPVFTEAELREGLGGFPSSPTTTRTRGGTGGGIIRIDAENLEWNGTASANGGDGYILNKRIQTREGGASGGGSGGTVLFNVNGNLSGSGKITANGGRGMFGFDRWETGSGGSGGRIRINYASNVGWTGTVKALGGEGGCFDPEEMRRNVQQYPTMIPPWADSLIHGGPGTIYWKHSSGIGKILIDGSGGVRGGVGKIEGEFLMDTVEVRSATVVSNVLKARALVLRDTALLKPDNPYVRLAWPIPKRYKIPEGYGLRDDHSPKPASYPTYVWQDSLQEVMSLEFSSQVFIDATSRIDASGFGHFGRKATSSGFANEFVGGSHGGYGGFGASNFIPPRRFGRASPTYGNPLEPQSFGEGGTGQYGYRSDITQWHYIHQFAGSGGAILRISCGGEIRIDGAILCNGADGQRDNFSTLEGNGGGAGGSLWLTTSSLSGTGIISASGGNGTYDVSHNNYGGGGGGGRIRIDYTSKAGWYGRVLAVGGKGAVEENHWRDPRNNGGPGTIYWNQLGGEKRIEINDQDGNRGLGFLAGSYPGTAVEIRSAVVATQGMTARTLMLRDSAVLTGDDYRAGLKLFSANSFPTHRFPVWGERVDKRVQLRVTGDLLIDNSSAIDFSGLGLYGRYTNRMPGGSHGGRGGTGAYQTTPGNPSPVYGDSLLPLLSGQGGYGEYSVFSGAGDPYMRLADAGASGGGALWLVVGGTVELDGKILADGFSAIPQERGGAYGAGGGAGGSILLRVGLLTGSGVLSASGGVGVYVPARRIWGGGGGGGRIAVYGNLASFGGRMKVDGGDGGAGGGVGPEVYRGQGGTIVTGLTEPPLSGTFSLTRTLPANGDSNVSRSTPIKLFFNRSIDISSFTFTCSPDPGGWTILWNITSDTLTLTHAPFDTVTAYTFEIGAVRDLTGNVLDGLPLRWRFSTGSTITSAATETELPTEFALYQNYPNPFNPSTTIMFSLATRSFVSLKVYDALGREVANLISEELPAGTYTKQWNAEGLPSGVYFYRLNAGSFIQTKKLMLLR